MPPIFLFFLTQAKTKNNNQTETTTQQYLKRKPTYKNRSTKANNLVSYISFFMI